MTGLGLGKSARRGFGNHAALALIYVPATAPPDEVGVAVFSMTQYGLGHKLR